MSASLILRSGKTQCERKKNENIFSTPMFCVRPFYKYRDIRGQICFSKSQNNFHGLFENDIQCRSVYSTKVRKNAFCAKKIEIFLKLENLASCRSSTYIGQLRPNVHLKKSKYFSRGSTGRRFQIIHRIVEAICDQFQTLLTFRVLFFSIVERITVADLIFNRRVDDCP